MGFDKWDKDLHYSSEQLKRICSAKEIPNKNIIDVNTENKTCIIQGNRGTYNVSLENCECFDFRTRKLPCKHMYWLANVFGELDNLAGIDTAIGEYSLQMERSEQISLFSEEQKEIKESLKKEGITLDTLNKGEDAFGCCDKYNQCSLEGKCLQSSEISKRCIYKVNLDTGKIFYSKKSSSFSQEKYDYIDNWYNSLLNAEREAFGEIVSTFIRLRRSATKVMLGNMSEYPCNVSAKDFNAAYNCMVDCEIFTLGNSEEIVTYLFSNDKLPFVSFDNFNKNFSKKEYKTIAAKEIELPANLQFTDSDYKSEIKNSSNLNEDGKIKYKMQKDYRKKVQVNDWLRYLKNENTELLKKFSEYFILISISPTFSFSLDEWFRDHWKLLPLKLDDFKFVFVEREINEKKLNKKDTDSDKKTEFAFRKMHCFDDSKL